MTETKVDLTKGGVCIVMCGATGIIQEYVNNPSIQFIECNKVPGSELTNIVNKGALKIVIITDGIPTYHLNWIKALCDTRKIPYLFRKSNQAIYETIKKFFPAGEDTEKPSSEDIRDAFVKGKLTPLIEHLDFTKSNVENARTLLRIAKERGIKSTESSLAQFVSIQRRKQNGTAIVKSARPKLDLSVEILEDMVQQLNDMKEFIIATCDENRMLKIKLDKFKKAMED